MTSETPVLFVEERMSLKLIHLIWQLELEGGYGRGVH